MRHQILATTLRVRLYCPMVVPRGVYACFWNRAARVGGLQGLLR